MFTNIPNNYASMWGELTFEYSSTTDSDVVINIYETLSDTLLGVKKFYSTSSAKINIAPMLFDTYFPAPQSDPTSGLKVPTNGFVYLRLEAGDESCEERTFTYAKSQIEAPQILTTLPTERILYKGESDTVTVVAPADTYIKYTLYGVPNDSEEYTLLGSGSTPSNRGVREFVTVADDYCQSYSALKVTLSCDSTVLGSVEYSLINEAADGYRVAWVSSLGAIEHYTFPIVVDKIRLSSSATLKNLRSAYGTEAEIEALSEIVSSPKVWRADSYEQIEVTTEEQYVRREGVLMIANIQIKEYD